MKKMDEAQLLAMAQAGDQAAFRELIAPQLGKLRRCVRRLVRHEDDADDVMQEVMLMAWRALPRFEGRSSLFTWLFRVAHNAAVNFLMREQRHRGVDLVDEPEPVHGDTPEALLDAKEWYGALEQGLRRLPAERRIPFERCVIGEESYRAAAAALHVPVGTVRSRIHRAREELGLLDAHAA